MAHKRMQNRKASYTSDWIYTFGKNIAINIINEC